MDNSLLKNSSHQQGHLTEPILDASYLDDELGLMLTNDLIEQGCGREGFGFGRHHLTLTTSSNNNTNNQEELTNLSSISGSILDQLDLVDELFSEEELGSRSFATSTTTPTTTESSSYPIPLHPTPSSQHQSTYSTDSLDMNQSLFSCKKPNYTIAFQGQDTGELIPDFNRINEGVMSESGNPLENPLSDAENNNPVERGKWGREIGRIAKIDKIDRIGRNWQLPDLGFLKREKIAGGLDQQGEKTVEKLEQPEGSVGNKVVDWPSLRLLLPSDYEKRLCTKPSHLREQASEEKETDDSTADDKRVKMRKKRLSLGYERKSAVDKFKRFSLQEIEEVGEVCRGIEEVLKMVEEEKGEKQEEKQEEKKRKSGKKLASGGGSRGPIVSRDNRDPLQPLIQSLTSLTRLPLPRSIVYSNSTHAKHLQNEFCPALYSIFSDGLLPAIETLWGSVHNSVWRVVEGSVGGAPTTQILSELVLRINSESEVMGEEGPLKFNAFVAGLLNLGTLPSYLDLLRTKDRLLRTHYGTTGFLYSINTTGKPAYDSLLTLTKPLNRIRYDLDIFYETKLLHCRIGSAGSCNKMKRSWSDERPMSCLAAAGKKNDLAKSRTSGNIDRICSGQKLASGAGRSGSAKVAPGNKIGKFKKLQLQWEMYASKEATTTPTESLVTSPVGVSRIPRLIGSGGGGRPGSASCGVTSPVGSKVVGGSGWRR